METATVATTVTPYGRPRKDGSRRKRMDPWTHATEFVAGRLLTSCGRQPASSMTAPLSWLPALTCPDCLRVLRGQVSG